MISYLSGKIVDETTESITLDVQGVGYLLACSSNTLDDFLMQSQTQTATQGNVKAWVFTHVREDILALYGFSTKMEKQIFESLLKVNGIGPKMALSMLSGSTIEMVAEMIENEDVKGLMKLPKVGKKKAEQIILTLKGKLKLADTGSSMGIQKKTPMKEQQKVISALVNLGFRSADVEEAVATLSADINFEDGVREGLALLSGNTN